MNDRKKPVIRNFGVREFKMEDELVQRLKGGRDGVFKEQKEKQCDWSVTDERKSLWDEVRKWVEAYHTAL